MDVLSLQIGRPIGRLEKPIINPNNLRIVAFDCFVMKDRKELVLFIDDIRETNRDGVIVDSYESLMPTDDLVRLQELRKIGFELTGKKVITDKKRKVGRVVDFTVDDTNYFITKIYIRPTLSKSLLSGNLIVDRSQVVEVTDKVVVVKDTFLEAREKKRSITLEPAN